MYFCETLWWKEEERLKEDTDLGLLSIGVTFLLLGSQCWTYVFVDLKESDLMMTVLAGLIVNGKVL